MSTEIKVMFKHLWFEYFSTFPVSKLSVLQTTDVHGLSGLQHLETAMHCMLHRTYFELYPFEYNYSTVTGISIYQCSQ